MLSTPSSKRIPLIRNVVSARITSTLRASSTAIIDQSRPGTADISRFTGIKDCHLRRRLIVVRIDYVPRHTDLLTSRGLRAWFERLIRSCRIGIDRWCYWIVVVCEDVDGFYEVLVLASAEVLEHRHLVICLESIVLEDGLVIWDLICENSWKLGRV